VKYSFVADMSSGWSGNLGFKMPENWSFDQFNEFTGASTGIDMDQVAVSGKDNGVSKVTKVNINPNAAFFTQLQQVEDQAYSYISGESSSTPAEQLVTQFYRQFSYSSPSWAPLAGGLNTSWLAFANSALHVSKESDFETLYDSTTGIKIGLPHM
ncbi:glycoside hydrolase domain-containing protein, partial [Lactobacillus delbrueckii subsp. bulgaricus]|nr:peptidoglycan-binding protein [Lactobacillus delbrueckii subsp. bulgaricus]